MKGLILAALAALCLWPAAAPAQVVSTPPSCVSALGTSLCSLKVPAGSNTTPSINFGTANTGIYGDATDVLFTISGTRQGYFSTSIFHVDNQFDVSGKITLAGHLLGTGTAPTLTLCGTSPSAVTGSDVSGQFTTGTGTPTSCTLTFASTYGAAPTCIVEDSTALASLTSFTTSTTTLVITTAAASSQKIMYHCISTS